MTHRLSDSTIKEINEFFVEQNYTKNHLTMDVRKANEMMLRPCGFVYIATEVLSYMPIRYVERGITVWCQLI